MAIIPALIPVIKEVTLDAPAASVEITVPSGYEILFLEWYDVYSDQISGEALYMRLNGDTAGNYDQSRKAFGTASLTSNAANLIPLGDIGDTDGAQKRSNGMLLIFNRASQEKVIIGTDVKFEKGGGGANDLTGTHLEAKWRNTSDAITTILVYASGGNLTAGSKFILRGLRTDKAPALGSQDIIQFIGSHEVTGTEASVTLPAIPPGFSQLWLFWHDVYGDSNTDQNIDLTFNGDTGNNYDYSRTGFGSASSTVNTDAHTQFNRFGDNDNEEAHTSGFVTIFNRASQEKVLIGTDVRVDKANGDVTIEDLAGAHLESKWRNTSAEISTMTLVPSTGNFSGGKFWLIGVKV